MRGEDRTSGALFSYVDMEARIPAKHPLRAMRRLTNAALAELDGAFSGLYDRIGRPSIAPERLLRATLLQLLYTIRSERQLVERIERSLVSLVRWAFHRRDRVRRLDVLKEPRPLAHPGDRAEVSGLAHRPAGSDAAFERRAFLGRRDFAQGVGVDEEFSAQRWFGLAAVRPQWRDGFPQDEAVERDARLDDDKDARLFRKAEGQESRLAYDRGAALLSVQAGLGRQRGSRLPARTDSVVDPEPERTAWLDLVRGDWSGCATA